MRVLCVVWCGVVVMCVVCCAVVVCVRVFRKTRKRNKKGEHKRWEHGDNGVGKCKNTGNIGENIKSWSLVFARHGQPCTQNRSKSVIFPNALFFALLLGFADYFGRPTLKSGTALQVPPSRAHASPYPSRGPLSMTF